MGQYEIRDGRVSVEVIDDRTKNPFEVDHMAESILKQDDLPGNEHTIVINKAKMDLNAVNRIFNDDVVEVVRGEFDG